MGEQETYDITAEEVCQLTKLGFPDELDPAGLHPVHVNPLPDDERVRVLSRGLNRNVKPHQSHVYLISNFFWHTQYFLLVLSLTDDYISINIPITTCKVSGSNKFSSYSAID